MGEFLITIVAFLVVLGPLVLIHELGHFLAARACGVTVLEFGLGFPPRALKLFEQGGTLFTLNWLPIGGFVRPLGEDFVKPLAEGEVDPDRIAFEKMNDERAARGKPRLKAKSVMEATPWQRILFLSAGAAMNILGAFLILIFSAVVGQPAPAVLVFATAPGSVAAAADLQGGDEVTAINGTAVSANDPDAATKIRAVLLESLAKPVTLSVKRGAETRDVTINPPASREQNSRGVYVENTNPGYPAADVLKAGDVIIAINDYRVTTVPGLQEYIKNNADKELTIQYVRDGQELTAKMTPKREGDKALIGVSIIPFDAFFGIAVESTTNGGIQKYDLPGALQFGLSRAWFLVEQTAKAPVNLIASRLRGEPQGDDSRLVSPVGIAQISSQVLTSSVQNNTPYLILNFIATISVALAITNLLPIPGLDGGRILFVLIELVRGKPMSPEREGVVHLVGLALLMALVGFLVINDLANPIGNILR